MQHTQNDSAGRADGQVRGSYLLHGGFKLVCPKVQYVTPLKIARYYRIIALDEM